MLAAKLTSKEDGGPPSDQRVLLRGVTWRDYEALLAVRGDAHPGVRLYFLKGDLELMSPSDPHEWTKKTLARLLEAYADESGIEFNGYGSLTMRHARKARGAEPDECYVVGRRKGQPDLAIEVEWKAGGLDKLDIYSGLGVRELWICRWERHKPVVVIMSLRRGRYVTASKSDLLPNLDMGLLAKFLTTDSQSQAVRSFRAALRRKSRS